MPLIFQEWQYKARITTGALFAFSILVRIQSSLVPLPFLSYEFSSPQKRPCRPICYAIEAVIQWNQDLTEYLANIWREMRQWELTKIFVKKERKHQSKTVELFSIVSDLLQCVQLFFFSALIWIEDCTF